MTKSEVIKLIGVATACFPSMMSKEVDLRPAAEAWYAMLGDMDYPLAEAALKKVIATAKFFPTIAEIREAAASLTPTDMPDGERAWDEFLREKRNHGYLDAPQSLRTPGDSGIVSFREPWDFSHPAIGATVKAMYGSWQASYETMQDEMLGVDRKHFIDMFKTITKRQREMTQLPTSVQNFAKLAAEAMKRLPSERAQEQDDGKGIAQSE